ncbi:MAG: carboxypeptidase regulatory-like domain-containing protein [Candidatus Sumerlaeaceae bacterium]|nr:carboxypeptidase regulatory-like domain-containing protein [Candidatus Sumerlaeaceae bacterium]
MTQRTPMIIVAALAVALLGALVSLNRKVAAPLPSAEASAANEADNNGDEFSWSDVGENGSRISLLDDAAPAPRAAAPKPPPPPPRTEDREAAMLRAAGESYIFGIVQDEERKPIAGAQVRLYPPDPMTTFPALREAVTDSEGSYTLYNLNDSAQMYIVLADAAGKAPTAQFVMLNGEPSRTDFTLPRGVMLTGFVKDATTSGAIAGATVYFPGRFVPLGLYGSVTTLSDGAFRFPNAPPGRVTTIAEAPGYQQASARIASPDDDAEIAMKPGGCIIRGRTVDRLTGKGVPGARVYAITRQRGRFMPMGGKGVLSGADGAFEFTDLAPGTQMLIAQRGMRSEPLQVELAEREVKEGVEIMLPSELFVTGRVEGAGNRKPLPGITIGYDSPYGRRSVLSDENGRFAFQTMAMDSYKMYINERGRAPVNDDGTTGVQRVIERKVPTDSASDEVVIRMKQVPFIQGKVTAEGRDGNPAPARRATVGASYYLGNDQHRDEVQTDLKGEFFMNLPDNRTGQGLLIARNRGGVAVARGRFPRNRPYELAIKRASLNGELLLTDGQGVAGVPVEAIYKVTAGGRNLEVRGSGGFTRNGGNFRLSLDSQQPVTLRFTMPDGKVISKEFEARQVVNKRGTFIYDPVSDDLITEFREGGGDRGRGDDGGRRGGRGGGPPGGGPRGEGGPAGGRPWDGGRPPGGGPWGGGGPPPGP